MKKILTASLVAMMAVTAARADIASTKYVEDMTTATANTASSALASAKYELEGKITAEATARENADTALSGRIAAFEGDGVGSVTAQVKAVSDALDAYQTANDAAVADMDAAYKAGDTQIRTDFAAADATTLQTSIMSLRKTVSDTIVRCSRSRRWQTP